MDEESREEERIMKAGKGKNEEVQFNPFFLFSPAFFTFSSTFDLIFSC